MSRNFEQEISVFAFMSYSWLSLLLACKLLCLGSEAFFCYDQDRKADSLLLWLLPALHPWKPLLHSPSHYHPIPHPQQLWCHGKGAGLGAGRPCSWVNSCVTFRKSFLSCWAVGAASFKCEWQLLLPYKVTSSGGSSLAPSSWERISLPFIGVLSSLGQALGATLRRNC